ncbi:MAG: hypothetical protein ABSG14_04385, partial [Verrucomicrobiia bacterium]
MKRFTLFVASGFVCTLAMITPTFAALVGANPSYPLVSYVLNNSTALTYNPTNQLFSMTSTPGTIKFSSSQGADRIAGGSLTINILVDNNGNLIGGVPANGGNDFVLK